MSAGFAMGAVSEFGGVAVGLTVAGAAGAGGGLFTGACRAMQAAADRELSRKAVSGRLPDSPAASPVGLQGWSRVRLSEQSV